MGKPDETCAHCALTLADGERHFDCEAYAEPCRPLDALIQAVRSRKVRDYRPPIGELHRDRAPGIMRATLADVVRVTARKPR